MDTLISFADFFPPPFLSVQFFFLYSVRMPSAGILHVPVFRPPSDPFIGLSGWDERRLRIVISFVTADPQSRTGKIRN